MAESRNNIIERNTFNFTIYGVYADFNSSYNTFYRNYINEGNGFRIISSNGNAFYENTLLAQGREGIYMYNSNGSIIFGNMFNLSGYGITIGTSIDISIVKNDFYVRGRNSWSQGTALNLYNTYNVTFFHNNVFDGSVSLSWVSGAVWDDGYPSGGNYWASYYWRTDYYSGPNQDQPGSDGIVDKPYDLGYGNKDRYPFMNPYREPSFEISASPQSQKFYAPQTKSYTIIITSVNSFILPVNLSCSWFGATPSGVTFSLSRSTITPPPNGKETSNLTVAASSTATIGSYTLRITGTSGSLVNYVDIVVTVLSASLDITPPEIGEPVQTPSNNTIQPNEKVKISVKVTDDESGISQVILSYTTDNGTTWTNLNMQRNAATSSYEVEVPEQQPGTAVKYKIVAYDNAGNSAIKDNNGYYYTYQVIPEFPSPIILLLFILTTMISFIFVREKLSLHSRRKC